MKSLRKNSGCKINLLLNTLGKRPDGFHELETVMQPVALFDEIEFTAAGSAVELTCDVPSLPCDGSNLVVRAANGFFEAAGLPPRVKLHLQKRIPMEAGLGGGSANAATTLLGLNELFGQPLTSECLQSLAARLGSDVAFFLQWNPALSTGRGERIEPLTPFPALRGLALLLVHPGFGISTAWAYKTLTRFPGALNGRAGRAGELIASLQTTDANAPWGELLYNSLEAPAFSKYPVIALYVRAFREAGALGALMSGSGSTVFAWFENRTAAERALEVFQSRFGGNNWSVVLD